MKTISRTSIHQNLKSLDVLYRNAPTTKKALFYSKLALLELCGWVEETMDSVVRSCACRKLRDLENRKLIEQDAIKRTHSFSYQTHFRRMLTNVIGLHGVERVECHIDSTKLDAFKVMLGNLKSRRDEHAHTYLGMTRTLDAPSVILQTFEGIYEGLQEVSEALKTKGW